jgi:hypothetical protein
MKLYLPGEKGRALCESDGRVLTTFKYRDVPFSDGSGIAKRILVGVCDQCGKVVSIPPQSTPSIKAARKPEQMSIEAVLPAVYLDALACYRINPSFAQDFRKPLVMYYVYKSAHDKSLRQRLVKVARLESKFFKKKTNVAIEKKRLSMKVSPTMFRTFDQLAKTTKLSKTDLIKNAITRINEDIVGPDHPAQLDELKSFAVFSIC